MTTPLKNYSLGLFLTEKNSLHTWNQAGILSREIAPYNLLADCFRKIYIFSCGDKGDLIYQKHLAPNIEIVCKDIRMPLKYYYWFLPFRHWRKIRQCHFLKTNQFKSRAALLAKLMRRHGRLIIRAGYLPSLFEKGEKGRASFGIKQWEKLAYRTCDLAMVTSPADRDYLIRNCRIAPEKIALIANYIDTALFAPTNGVKKNDHIIFVGRFTAQKNLPLLIESLIGTNIGLDIIGPIETKEQVKTKEQLQKLADQQKISLNFLGKISNENLPAALNQYNIFVLPSLYEGTPKALLEAMSCGLACIATHVAGSREIIIDGQNGLLSRVDAEDLKEKILKLNHDAGLRKILGQNAREFVVKNFSLSSQIQKEINLYENLI